MSLKQRRDHPASPMPLSHLCWVCGDPTEVVTTVGYDRSKPVSQRRTEKVYVRHVRRWFRKP